MEAPTRSSSSSLFQVYLRLRPAPAPSPAAPTSAQPSLYPQLPTERERFLTVEPAGDERTPVAHLHGNSAEAGPTKITIHPPSDSRKRAVEKFAFTRVFEEETQQLDVFRDTGHVALIDGVVAEGRDGLLATLGVTGSGKSHTILGTRTQRGLTQLSLDYLFRSLGSRVVHPLLSSSLVSSLASADASEAQILSASSFLDSVYGDGGMASRATNSRAATPAVVGDGSFPAASLPQVSPPRAFPSVLSILAGDVNVANTAKARTASIRRGHRGGGGLYDQWAVLGLTSGGTPRASGAHIQNDAHNEDASDPSVSVPASPPPGKTPRSPSKLAFWKSPRMKFSKAKIRFGVAKQEIAYLPQTPRRTHPPMPRPATFATQPSLDKFDVQAAPAADYAVLVSMYEVYNDRIFDLLTPASSAGVAAHGAPQAPNKDAAKNARRALLFKPTEQSPDRKLVAGLRKVVCGSYDEAMMILETGLMERRVAGTGSNSVSSRSHGFFVVEVKKKVPGKTWRGGGLTVVDLAGSERARNAKTAGATLAEAGKINESLMYLGQCLQMQSDSADSARPAIVPFRQCKLTELLFSNSFPTHASTCLQARHAPQKSIMIVTADPLGDFNATSQILRYSALAREVTVPRIPSVASTVSFVPGPTTSSRPGSSNDGGHHACANTLRSIRMDGMTGGRSSPETMTVALTDLVEARSEAERLADEVAILSLRLAEEQGRRRVAEEQWARAGERCDEVEREVREECCDEMERRLAEEKRRWMVLRDEEKDEMDSEMDRKIEMLTGDGNFKVHEDAPMTADARVTALEDENTELRKKLDRLERETQCRSPSRATRTSSRKPLAEAKLSSENAALGKENMQLATELNDLVLENAEVGACIPTEVSVPVPASMKMDKGIPRVSPSKKIRKLTPRAKMGFADDEDGVFG